MFESLSFEYPYLLLLIGVFLLCDRFCKAKVTSYYVPHLAILVKSSKLNTTMITFFKWSAIILSIVALASPIKELQTVHTKQDGIDMVLALDTSGSMKQFGFNPENPTQNRWEVVQTIVNDFINKRVNDTIGVVVFGTSVMTASPLSYDKKAQNKIINSLRIGIVGDKTALLNSIATSINILKNRETKSKIIIALTDGDDTASSIPLEVVTKLAEKYNIKIYTILIGANNNYVLSQLAKSSGGETFVAQDKKNLQKIYETIDSLEKTKLEHNKLLLKEYLFFYPLIFAFLSLLIFIYLKNRYTN